MEIEEFVAKVGGDDPLLFLFLLEVWFVKNCMFKAIFIVVRVSSEEIIG